MDRLTTLELFCAIVHRGSLVGAAEEMGVSKAAVSKALRDLEAEMGVRLLDRTTRSLAPTQEGLLLLERAPDITQRYEVLREELRADKDSAAGTLKLSAPASFDNEALAQIVTEYMRVAPDVRLDMTLSDSYVSLIEDGFDAAIRIGDLDDSSLIARRIIDVRNVVIASPDFLSAFGTPAHPKDITALPCIEDKNERNSRRWPFQEGGHLFRVAITPIARVNSPNLSVALAAAGHGLVRAPDFAARTAIERGEVVPILQNFALQRAALHIVYPDRRYVPKRLSLFIDVASRVLKACAPDY